jgi:hypothetical protein
MQGLIKNKALGLIETVGLVGAIEACDAAAKAANVIVNAAEVTDPALVTLKIFGELAAVQAAVDAGARAAARVGQLHSAHVIPNPDDNLDVIMGGSLPIRAPKVPGDKRLFAREPGPLVRPRRPLTEPPGDIDWNRIESMKVTQLRIFARSIPNLAIKGREISRADKVTLIREIRRALGIQ